MIGGIDPNEHAYSFVAMPFPNTVKASEYAPNAQCFQNTMRPSMFFPIQHRKYLWDAPSTKGQVSGDDGAKA